MEKKTIFIIDDDPTILIAGREALCEYYNVVSINSGEKLFKMLSRKTPDLILLDIEMPEISGLEIISRLKINPETEKTPVIFLTARSDAESELEGLSVGAVDYVTKPFSPSLLLKRVELHMTMHEQYNQLTYYTSNLLKLVEERTRTIKELKNALIKTMAELVEHRDDDTGGHVERTQNYVRILLQEMLKSGSYEKELAECDIELMILSAQLHDVGKIIVPDNILQKPGKLTTEEFEIIKEHTRFGEKVIKRIQRTTTEQAFLNYARDFAGAHHEKWNGTGYPRGLAGENIPLLGRIMAIADVYDALVSERPYKKPYSHDEAVKIIIEGSGSHFDPGLVVLFLNVSDDFRDVAGQVSEDKD